MYDVTAVVVAGGRGSRMKEKLNKQYLKLAGKPLLAYSLEIFERCSQVRDIVIVTASGEEEYCRENVVKPYAFEKIRAVIPGGEERQDSVWNGLKKAQNCKGEYVAVHDGARPLLTSAILESVISAAASYGIAAAGVPVKDTIKLAGRDGFVRETPNREDVWIVQTPQVFKKEILMEAYRNARNNSLKATDDTMFAEELGCGVKLVLASYENLKITTPEDLEAAESIIKWRKD